MIRWIVAAVFLTVLLVYVACLCPSPYWLDSSEFAAASFLLGVAHPPGHPAALIFGKLFTFLPLGPVAFRVGLGQALCSALAAAVLTLTGIEIGRRAQAGLSEARPLDEAVLALLAAGAALCTSLGYAAAFQAVRPEVYSLQRLLAALALLGCVRYKARNDLRDLGLAALCLGLALANHHFLALLLILPAPVLLLPFFRSRRGAKHLLILGLALCLGLLLYTYLPVRALDQPLINWGSPSTLARFLWVVSAKAFQRSLRGPEQGDDEVLGAVLFALHPAGAVLAVIGIYLLLRRATTRELGVYLLGVVALNLLGRALLGFDIANPDAYGYLSLGIDLLSLCACAGAVAVLMLSRHLLARAGRPASLSGHVAGMLAVLTGGAWGMGSLPMVDLRRFHDQDTLLGEVLHDAPPRARLFTTSFQTVFGLWYRQGVEGARPDVELIHAHFLHVPGYREDVLSRHPGSPDLARILGGEGLAMGPLLESLSRRRALFEYDPDTPPSLTAHLAPHLLLWQVLRDPGGEAARRERAARAQQRREAVLRRLDLRQTETRRVALWRSYTAAMLACAQGDWLSFEAEMARAKRIYGSGVSPELARLAERCQRP